MPYLSAETAAVLTTACLRNAPSPAGSASSPRVWVDFLARKPRREQAVVISSLEGLHDLPATRPVRFQSTPSIRYRPPPAVLQEHARDNCSHARRRRRQGSHPRRS